MPFAVRTEVVDLEHFPQEREHFSAERLDPLPPKPVYEGLKRVFDLLFGLLALLVLAVPMAIIAALIRLDSPGRALYRQTRLGKDQKPFVIFKFRTMVINAEEDGARWASWHDHRTTRLGRFLRHSHLDELPQLFNIIRGEMSFVGPRPERPEFYDVFDTYIDGFRQRMLVIPGLTGLAQVNGGYDLLPEEKIVYDLQYIKDRSLLLDLKCLLKTVAVILRCDGAM